MTKKFFNKLTQVVTKFTFHFVAFSILIFSTQAMSYQQVSKAQIAAFQKMSPSQQKALAKSMGFDISNIGDIGNISKQLSGTGIDSQPIVNTKITPRASQVDQKRSSDKQIESLGQMKELKPFGYDVFANSPQTFSPTMDIAIPAGYIVAPGDKISIQVFGKESDELELEVNREGQIVFPTHGPFAVAGLSFSEMKRLLIAKIKEKVLGVDVVIGMASLRSMRVFVLGAAFKPGPYNLSSLSSIIHAVFAAGGISDIGSLRNIQLKRSGKLIKTLDLYDLLIQGDSSNDVLLQSGDVVFIPPVGKVVSIDGEVRRPAIYELATGDDFASVLAMAGGLLPSAYAKSTFIERYNQNDLRSIVNVDFTNDKQLLSKAQAGDFIRVMKAADMFSQSITLIGALTRPGKYQWQQGQRVTDLLPHVNSHTLDNADLNYSLIIREIDQARNIEVLQFGLAKAITNPESEDNFLLKANDKLLVFSRVSQLYESSLSLDMLAYTQEELFKKEQKLAKDKFKTKQFWQKYDHPNKIAEIEVDKTTKLANQSIVQISGGDIEEKVNVKELTLFSRQRLLMPIIQKLKNQGGSGQPIQLIEIDGSVKFPGVYPLVRNGRVDDLIAAAGGLNESAYLARAEITRNQVHSQFVSKRSISVNLTAALQGEENDNILLQSKDRLNIHKIPAWSENHVIELRGEFVFPGKYTIRRGENLSDLIAKAGGFTPFAHQEGSVFTRVKLKELELQNLIKLSGDLRIEMASKSLSDSDYSQSYSDVQTMLNDLTKLKPVGRLVINLPKVVKDNDYDILLEGGDALYVPTLKNSVNVIGQVQVTSSHIYDKSLTAQDYLAQSGGSKKRADEGRVYIIAANGSIKLMDNSNWFASNAGDNMKPGDTVVVPLDSEYMNNLTLWTSATTIMYNTAIAIAAISGL
ncbi:SLBB domain-containing protein [Candidatus Colwellia aromaticivorans]|uniref:SLBB domain-containing protein n=1 Tax=Candidatus Colwellia aromaticivorans TaxID=2267621 RepID=UPI000DF19D02|nr:SLBB domain-containing protein [Candidatus Colwellia aromaticivorans]